MAPARRSEHLFTYAQCLLGIEGESHAAEADALFQRALRLAPVGELAEKIKGQQRRLAERVMRANAQGLPRMDAVMYLSNALEAYRSLDLAGQKQLLAEVPAVGQKGLAINNPDQKHQLRLYQGGAPLSGADTATAAVNACWPHQRATCSCASPASAPGASSPRCWSPAAVSIGPCGRW